MSHRLSAPRLLLLSMAVLSALAIGAPAFAQTTTAPHSVNVVELEYAPSSPLQGLDLRAGRYLLELRGPAAGPYAGVLRGPNNEIVDAQLVVTRSGCSGTALPSSAVLQTQPATARPHINPVALRVVGATGGGCQLQATMHEMGLTSGTGSEGPPECETPDEIGVASDQGPTCLAPPNLPGTLPDLVPGQGINLAGQYVPWSGNLELQASSAVFKSQGRCFFDYSHMVRNVGVGHASPSVSALRSGHRFGPQLDASQVPALAPGGTQLVSGQIALPPGIWRLFAYADSKEQVAESNGMNNVRSLRVKVSGSCAGSFTTP
jgi:hypothetical protein